MVKEYDLIGFGSGIYYYRPRGCEEIRMQGN
jgi:hypothetical protein